MTADGEPYPEGDPEPVLVEVDGVSYYEAGEAPEVCWLATEDGAAYAEADKPLDRLTNLLAEDAKYATIYERILGLTAQDAGASMPTINEAVDNDELLKSPRLYAPHFIDKLEHGLDEEVRERGNNFSAGQRQLLSFARTILHKPSVMILDEATANIDTETELLIQDSLEKMRSVGTMLIVAHRLSTIQHADNIIVLSHGKILEQGTHQQLLAAHGRYYQLYTLQYHKEQMENK